MRILHIITTLGVGGAETALLRLISRGSPEFQAGVLCLGPPGSVGKQIASLGVPVSYLGWRSNFVNPIGAISGIALARKFRPHLIQGWMPHGNLAATLVGTCVSAPVLWNVRMSLDDLRNERWFTAKLIKWGAKLSSLPQAIVYNSHAGARQHEAIGYDARKSKVIPNGFDCQQFRPDAEVRARMRAELGLDPDAVVIGLIARFHAMKDHRGFFHAAAHVVKTHPSTRFLLAGTGVSPDQPTLRSMLEHHGLEDRVALLGERSDIANLNASLDIACSSSSRAEGFSNSIGEAMACGVPCVATDVGDSAVIIGNTGTVVRPGNPEALACALIQLIEAGAVIRRELGDAARQRILHEFSLPMVLHRYQDLYQESFLHSTAGQSAH